MVARMRTAVVTGAGGGLGRAIAIALAGRGYAVWATDVEAAAAARTAAEIGGNAQAATLDVRDEAACRELATAVATEAGSLDLWVNNAGVLATGLAWEQDEATRGAMLSINAAGTMNGTVAALERMVPAGRGHVVNVISLAGIVAAPGEVAYSASKHAAMAFTLGTLFDLRRAGHRGIDVSAVCPDGIWTPMLEDKLDDPDARLLLRPPADARAGRRRRRQADRAPTPDPHPPPLARPAAADLRPLPQPRPATAAGGDVGRQETPAAL